jgi:hypothetical protein
MDGLGVVILMAIFVAFFAFVVVFIINAFVQERKTLEALRASGVTTDAQIVDKERRTRTEKDSKGFTETSHSYYLKYQYSVSGVSYTQASSVRYDLYENTPVGTAVSVVYLPTDPKTARLAAEL